MKFIKNLCAITLGLGVTAAFASPAYLITHNKTNEESNAYIDGTIASPYPTAANSTRQIYWNLVRMACYGHSTGNKCSAVIKMASNTTNPITLGTVTMDLVSGDITPKTLTSNGYTITVVGLAETTITKN